MKLKFIVLLAASALALQATAAEPKKSPTTADEKIGYAVGAELAGKFKKEKIEFDYEMAIQAIRDVMAGKSQMDPEEIHFVMSGFQAEVRRKVKANKMLAANENRDASEKFLDDNKAKDGVLLLPSGVQYKILKPADGVKPRDTDIVVVNYKGSLIDGTVFDKSEPGKPANLKVAALITGWRELMQVMPVGSKWQVWIPPKQAYGERGAGTVIGPNEVLVFDIELVGIGK